MKEETYKRCIQILESAFNWQLPKGSLQVWWAVLDKEKIYDEDFEDGCIQAIRNFKRFPSLNELIEAVKLARNDRLEHEWQTRKQEENRYRDLNVDSVLTRAARDNPKLKKRILITRRLLKGEIDKPTWERLLKEAENESG